jgi:hypothetical protein
VSRRYLFFFTRKGYRKSSRRSKPQHLKTPRGEGKGHGQRHTGTDRTSGPLECDNQAAIKILLNPTTTKRSKHIDVLYHFARERIARKEVQVNYIATDDMVADIMTKALAEIKLVKFRGGMGMHE